MRSARARVNAPVPEPRSAQTPPVPGTPSLSRFRWSSWVMYWRSGIGDRGLLGPDGLPGLKPAFTGRVGLQSPTPRRVGRDAHVVARAKPAHVLHNLGAAVYPDSAGPPWGDRFQVVYHQGDFVVSVLDAQEPARADGVAPANVEVLAVELEAHRCHIGLPGA